MCTVAGGTSYRRASEARDGSHDHAKAAKLVEVLQLGTKTGAFKRSMKYLLEKGCIEYNIPDKPNSRLQKYRLTEKGRARLKKS